MSDTAVAIIAFVAFAAAMAIIGALFTIGDK